MRPIHPRNFGTGSGKIRVRFNNGSSVVNGTVVRQTGTNKYIVTSDGTNRFTIRLAQTATVVNDLSNAAYANVGTIRLLNPTPNAVLTPTYNARVVTGAGGSGHVVNNILTVTGGTLANGTAMTLRVGSVSGGAITNVVVQSQGEYLVPPGTTSGNVRVITGFTSNGSGVGGTISMTMQIANVQITSNGTLMENGNLLRFSYGGVTNAALTGGTIDAFPVGNIAVNGAGTITGTTITNTGMLADQVALSALDILNAKNLQNRKALTVDGRAINWRASGSTATGEADVEVV